MRKHYVQLQEEMTVAKLALLYKVHPSQLHK